MEWYNYCFVPGVYYFLRLYPMTYPVHKVIHILSTKFYEFRWYAVGTWSLPIFKVPYCFPDFFLGYFFHKRFQFLICCAFCRVWRYCAIQQINKDFLLLIIFFSVSLSIVTSLSFMAFRIELNVPYFLMVLKKFLMLPCVLYFSAFCNISFKKLLFSLCNMRLHVFLSFHTFPC